MHTVKKAAVAGLLLAAASVEPVRADGYDCDDRRAECEGLYGGGVGVFYYTTNTKWCDSTGHEIEQMWEHTLESCGLLDAEGNPIPEHTGYFWEEEVCYFGRYPLACYS